jgi:hypothetical protein
MPAHDLPPESPEGDAVTDNHATCRKLAVPAQPSTTPALDWSLDPDTASITAVIADLTAVDRDLDEYTPGAFAATGDVLISQWQHGSWHPGLLPVGKGRITEEGGLAVFRGAFLQTQAARETFTTLRALAGLIQWSYGLDILEVGAPTQAGARRSLVRLAVHEVSPVLVGAGIGTRTVGTVGNVDQADEVMRELVRSVRIGLEADQRRELLDIRGDLRSAA